jgi:hypothetical protein
MDRVQGEHIKRAAIILASYLPIFQVTHTDIGAFQQSIPWIFVWIS